MARWIAPLLAISVIGCSSGTAIPNNEKHPIQTASVHLRGGPFTAGFSGTFIGQNCVANKQYGRFTFSGTGSGKFFGNASESGDMRATPYIKIPPCPWTGSATLVSKSHPNNSITVSLTGAQFANRNWPPCTIPPKWVVIGGSGKFSFASGSGTVAFRCGNGTYTSAWKGTLTF